MWIELVVRSVGNFDFETQAVDTDLIDIVKPGSNPEDTCWVWSIDAYPVFEVQMPYKDLLAKLNGDEPTQAADEYEPAEDCPPHVSFPLKELRAFLQADLDVAWSWHCNFAMPMQDEGVSHEQANRAAARIMVGIFGVDVTKHKAWEVFERSWKSFDVDVKQDACPRKECERVELLRASGLDVVTMFCPVGVTGRNPGWSTAHCRLGDEKVVGYLQADFINSAAIIPESIRFVPST